MEDVLFKDESFRIVGAAIRVWREMGFGYLEKVYENSLAIELELDGFDVRQQHPVPVLYRNKRVGDYFADILVNETILLELKTAKSIDNVHIAQTLNYLKATRLRLGMVLNFGPDQMTHKRLVL